ncbi:hypothetical protein ACFSE1_18975 [Rhizobium helianthi]|uniref:Uncharacterized protein n=1 Tax=Rhizobium helianthi TaxID=1132695 RepID=A0ABW4M8M2_9HYPH
MKTGSAVRKSVPDVIQSHRRMISIVRAAELGNHPDYATLAPELRADMVRCDRLARRLYQQLSAAFGAPAKPNAAVELFLTVDAVRLRQAAICIGLAYHLPSFGEVLDRRQLESIVNAFGQPTVFRALSYTALVPGRRVALGSLEDCLAMVEPDGWVLVRQWAEHAGVDPRWRIHADATAAASLRRDVTVVAAPLVSRALADLAEEDSQS